MDDWIKYPICFILGWLMSRMMGNGFSVGAQKKVVGYNYIGKGGGCYLPECHRSGFTDGKLGKACVRFNDLDNNDGFWKMGSRSYPKNVAECAANCNSRSASSYLGGPCKSFEFDDSKKESANRCSFMGWNDTPKDKLFPVSKTYDAVQGAGKRSKNRTCYVRGADANEPKGPPRPKVTDDTVKHNINYGNMHFFDTKQPCDKNNQKDCSMLKCKDFEKEV